MEMLLSKYPALLYVIINRLSPFEATIGIFGFLGIIVFLLFHDEDILNKEIYSTGMRCYVLGLIVSSILLIAALLLPSTDLALNLVTYDLIDPSEYGGNFEQYQYDIEVLKNFIQKHY